MSATHVSILDMKADRKATRETRNFVMLISFAATLGVISSSLIAVAAFFTEGLGLYTYAGIAAVAMIIGVVGPAIREARRTGKTATN